MIVSGAELLRVIASRPRPAGSTAEEQARAECSKVLAICGFEIAERPFEYSAFPGLLGTPLIGALLMATAVWSALKARATGADLSRAIVIGAALCFTCTLAWWLGRYGTAQVPFMRRSGVNLEARRGEGVPKVWLVAHLDSKAQPVSIFARATGAVISAAAWGALVTLWAEATAGMTVMPWITGLSWVAAVGALPLVLSWVHHGTDEKSGAGALDNGSGVATVLCAAARMDGDIPLGVLLTTGEELGLAGARGWLAGTAALDRGIAINCDGIDDHGALTCTVSRDNGILKLSMAALDLDAIGGGSDAIRVRRSIPGVLFDSLAFANAGWTAMTVSRGTLSSLRRVHTRADTLDRLAGIGVDLAATFIASLAGSIIAGRRGGTNPEGDRDRNGSTGD